MCTTQYSQCNMLNQSNMAFALDWRSTVNIPVGKSIGKRGKNPKILSTKTSTKVTVLERRAREDSSNVPCSCRVEGKNSDVKSAMHQNDVEIQTLQDQEKYSTALTERFLSVCVCVCVCCAIVYLCVLCQCVCVCCVVLPQS